MKPQQLKDALIKEAANQGYDLTNLNTAQEAYLAGAVEKIAMTKESWAPLVAAIPVLAKLVTGGLAAYSGIQAARSAAKGEWGNAALNALGAVPGVGLAGKALGWGGKALGGAGLAGKAIGAGTKMTNWAGSGKMLPTWGGAGVAMTNPVSTAAVTGGLTAAPWVINKMMGGDQQQPQQQAPQQQPMYQQQYHNPYTRMS